jgi:trigger factor
MKVERQNIDELNATITVNIGRADYDSKYQKALQDYRHKVQLKGFRKGKTPMTFIKKMYGKGILADIVNDVLQKSIVDYLTEEKIDFLGQPLPSEKQKEIDFESTEDFEFIFDLGLAPEFELKGLEGDNTLPRFSVKVPKKMLNEELDLARRRHGTQILAEDEIQTKDIIHFKAWELEGDERKKNGWETDFTLMVDQIADEALKKDVLTKKKGDVVRFNIFTLEKDRDESYVRKYFLNLDENEEKEIGNDFEGEISEVKRIEPAKLNKEFYQKNFGDLLIEDAESAKEAIKKDILKHYDRQSDAILYKEIQDLLMEQNPIELPVDFLKRWLKTQNAELTDETLEKEFEPFTLNLKWKMLKSRIAKDSGVKVEQEELTQEIKNRVISYLGPYQDEAMIEQMSQRLLQDQNQVEKLYEEILADKIFDVLKGKFKLTRKPISIEKFNEEVKKINEKHGGTSGENN